MAEKMRRCRVCGREYKACRTPTTAGGGFRWQDVACSPACGAEYLRRVNEARNPPQKVEPPAPRARPKQKRAAKEAPPVMVWTETVEEAGEQPGE